MVTKSFKGFHDSLYGFSAVMTNQQLYVFKDKNSRFFDFQYSGYIKKQRASRVFKASHLTNNTEWLTRKPRKKNVVIRNAFRCNLCNITMGQIAKVFLIDMLTIVVNFTGKNACCCEITLSCSVLDGMAKPANTSE